MLETEGDESSNATPYASMGGASTVDITASNTDALVETSNIYTDSNFWSFSSSTLHPINLSAGYYMVHYYMSMTYTDGDAESALYLLTSLYKNNINQTNLISERKLQKRDGSDIGSTSGSGLIKIESPTDNLTFKVNDDNGRDIDITKLNITIQRVGTIDNGTLPVELSSFDAMITSTDNVSLNWTVQSETNGSGYRIYRNAINDFNSALMLEEFVSALNLSQTHTYSFVDSEIDDSYLNVFYWLQFIELDNSTQLYGPVMVHLENNQEDVPEIIFNEGIKSAYPNPFNPDVTISYYLNSPKAANFQVYNLKGQLINKLTSATENVGFHQISWDGKDVSGRSVSSGTYFIKATNLKNDTPIKVILSK